MSTQWKKVTVGEIAEVKGGKRLPKGKLVQDEPTPFPYLRVTDFGDNGLDTSAIKYIDEDAQSKVSRYTITNRDIYISIAGTIGRVGIVPAKFSGANLTENAAKICEIHPHVDERFLMYFLRTENGQGQIAGLTVGTSQPKLALFRIKEIEISLPDLPTQRKIAGILSAYDDLIENNLRRIKILEQMAQSLYREWFVHFRFPGHESAQLSESPLGRVPKGWASLFGEHVDYKEGPGLRKWQYRKEGIPFLNIRTLGDNDIDLTSAQYLDPVEVETKYQHFLLDKFDHVVSSSGTIGRVVTVREAHLPLMLNTSIIRMRPNGSRVGLWQLKHFLISEGFQNQAIAFATGAAQPNFGPSHLKQMTIIAPPESLSKAYERLATPLEEAIHSLIATSQNLRRTRDLLLPKLLQNDSYLNL